MYYSGESALVWLQLNSKVQWLMCGSHMVCNGSYLFLLFCFCNQGNLILGLTHAKHNISITEPQGAMMQSSKMLYSGVSSIQLWTLAHHSRKERVGLTLGTFHCLEQEMTLVTSAVIPLEGELYGSCQDSEKYSSCVW